MVAGPEVLLIAADYSGMTVALALAETSDDEITVSGWRYRDALGDTFKIRPSDIDSVEKDKGEK